MSARWVLMTVFCLNSALLLAGNPCMPEALAVILAGDENDVKAYSNALGDELLVKVKGLINSSLDPWVSKEEAKGFFAKIYTLVLKAPETPKNENILRTIRMAAQQAMLSFY